MTQNINTAIMNCQYVTPPAERHEIATPPQPTKLIPLSPATISIQPK
jgi:hypothetical protein